MISQTQDIASEVTAVFQDAAVTFPIVSGATWADLAEMMEDMGADHDGDALYVRVKCTAPKRAHLRRLAA